MSVTLGLVDWGHSVLPVATFEGVWSKRRILLRDFIQWLLSVVPFNLCNSDVGDNVGLAKLAVPLCGPDTGGCKPPTTLSPPSVSLSL